MRTRLKSSVRRPSAEEAALASNVGAVRAPIDSADLILKAQLSCSRVRPRQRSQIRRFQYKETGTSSRSVCIPPSKAEASFPNFGTGDPASSIR